MLEVSNRSHGDDRLPGYRLEADGRRVNRRSRMKAAYLRCNVTRIAPAGDRFLSSKHPCGSSFARENGHLGRRHVLSRARRSSGCALRWCHDCAGSRPKSIDLRASGVSLAQYEGGASVKSISCVHWSGRLATQPRRSVWRCGDLRVCTRAYRGDGVYAPCGRTQDDQNEVGLHSN
jgi:hypothetical protein